MEFRFISRRQSGLSVIDSQFPQAEPFGFRNIEINEYLNRIRNSRSFTMPVTKPGPLAWFSHSYGITSSQFRTNKTSYLNYYPQSTNKIHYLNKWRHYSLELAYSFFLAETYTLLPFYEKNKVPFVFVLYPGGGFGLNNNSSDAMLKAVIASPNFRSVIVSQQITKDYLLRKKFCSADQIEYIYGGFAQFRVSQVKTKKKYPGDKTTLDICFVAAKYSDRGIDKGYDLFIETAKLLIKRGDDFRFHVVGGFSERDIDVNELGHKIKFYGYRQSKFLRNFYSKMDIMLSPNRPFKLYPGNFDGFHLGADASYCGTALFVSDELKMNYHYKPGRDIVIISLNAKKIADEVMKYHDEPKALYKLSEAGQKLTQKLFDIDRQVDARLKVFSKFTKLEQ